MNYRPEIDGLRSIAVLPVIFFHAGFKIFSGGFVGVDVFFVISGYLITSIIYQEIVDRRFSIWRFYERRARRILPALIVVSLSCIPFAWFWMLPNEFNDFSQSLVGVASFTSNILFWQESGYFAEPSELKPLLHTWSLSIEEQFYILYPLMLLVLYNFFSRGAFIIIGIFALLSLGFAQWASFAYPAANFYLLPSRAWELGVGAMVALWLNKYPRLNTTVNSKGSLDSPLVCEFAGVLGLMMIIYAIFVFDETLPFPSFWTLIPVLGTALIIIAADSNTIVGRMLSLRFLVGIGLISYSAYLWHQPLFAFARIRLIDGVPPWVFILLIVLNFGLAWGTWLIIEMPARKQLKLTGRQLLGRAFIGCMLVMIIGIVGQQRGVLGYPDSVDFTNIVHSDISPVRIKCHATERKPIDPSDACFLGGENISESNIYLWGDSHGVELSYALAEELKNKNAYIHQSNKSPNLIQLTASQCIPTPGVSSTRESHCVEHNKHVFEFLIKQAQPGIVILTARWPLYLIGERVQQINGCNEGTDFTGRFITSPTESNRNQKVANKIQQTIIDLTGAGHKVVFVHAAPEPGCNIPTLFARQDMFSIKNSVEYSIETHLKRQFEVTQLLSLTSDENITVFDQTAVFCDKKKSICFAPDEVGLFHFDNNHPSLYASRLVALKLLEKLIRINWLTADSKKFRKEEYVK
jgi:peptidoglycan/LPS O-acetylase OafA/YrhL